MVESQWRAGMQVWLPNERGDEPFIAGEIMAIDAKGLTIRIGGMEQVFDPDKTEVLPGNVPSTTAYDHCALIHMNEPCVLENSRLRYLANDIYTLVGTIMIAINPFVMIPIYGSVCITHDWNCCIKPRPAAQPAPV